MGAIASAYGVPASLVVAGAGSILMGAIAFVWLRRIQARRGVAITAPTLPATREPIGRGVPMAVRDR